MPFTEGDLYVCSFAWMVGGLLILLAVWMVLSHKNRSLRRRQRRYREVYDATIGHTRRRRKDD